MRAPLALLGHVFPGYPGRPPAPPDAAALAALIARGSGRNYAATDDHSPDPRLHSRLVRTGLDEARARADAVIAGLPRWRVERVDGATLWATRRTPLVGFVDDIHLLFEPAVGGTRISARSASRVGRSDLGQNRRNLAELWRALDAAGAPAAGAPAA